MIINCDPIIKVSDIQAIKGESNYSRIITSKSNTLTSKTLKHWQEKIGGSSFVRIHKSYLINKNQIQKINLTNKTIQMKNGFEAKISRRVKIKELLQLI